IYRTTIRARLSTLVPFSQLRRITLAVALPGVLATALGVLALTGCHRAAETTPPPAKVTVAHPIERQLTDWDEYTARLEAIDSVEVRARVSGYLESVHFRAGSVVMHGDLLFLLQPPPYEAQVRGAEGDHELAQSRLNLAQKNLARVAFLIKSNAMSKEEAETRAAVVRQAEAGVAASQAAVDAARLDVEFTRVTAPVSGRVSRKMVTEGNLINGGGGTQGTLLTTIVSLDPPHVYFEAHQRDYLKYLRLPQAGARPGSPAVQNPGVVGTRREGGVPPSGLHGFRRQPDRPRHRDDPGPRHHPEPRRPARAGTLRAAPLDRKRRVPGAADPGRGDPERPGAEVRVGGRRSEPRPLPPG